VTLEMSGHELSVAIRDSAVLVQKPIVIGFTAGSDGHNDSDWLKVGMSGMLYKPVTANQLNDFFENMAEPLPPASITCQ